MYRTTDCLTEVFDLERLRCDVAPTPVSGKFKVLGATKICAGFGVGVAVGVLVAVAVAVAVGVPIAVALRVGMAVGVPVAFALPVTVGVASEVLPTEVEVGVSDEPRSETRRRLGWRFGRFLSWGLSRGLCRGWRHCRRRGRRRRACRALPHAGSVHAPRPCVAATRPTILLSW